MIDKIEINNFRCYERISITKCSQITVIVGDNGSGKTALLEAIFLTLGSSPDLTMRFSALRGIEGNMTGAPHAIERALWGDMFFNGDMQRVIFIKLSGQGVERRSLRVSRNVPRTKLVTIREGSHRFAGVHTDDGAGGGIRFAWMDYRDNKHEILASLTNQGLRIEFLENSLPERPTDQFYYISATGAVSGHENATRFSELSLRGQKTEFLDIFRKEYPWIADISVEMHGGFGCLYATVDKPVTAARPLAFVSGGINRVLSILLCIAAARDGVVLIDEIDNGIHHEHHVAVWRMVISMAKKFNTQLIMTTHSNEWLQSWVAGAGEDSSGDASLWRVKSADGVVEVKEFSGPQAFIAIQSGAEVR